MKIKSLELNNYRLYRGVNNITFPDGNEKNLFLISGQNGFGKTTFLHSLLWCLYGRLIVDVDDSFRKEMSSGKYNNSAINSLNEFQRIKLTTEVSPNIIEQIKNKGYSFETEHIKEFSQYVVSIEFADVFIPSIPCRSLKITRCFDVVREEETVDILIDGIKNELTTAIGHDVFINDFILNKDKFVEIVNHYLKTKIDNFREISPEILFDSNLKKQNPKVHNYDDFESKIYADFEKLNKKKYFCNFITGLIIYTFFLSGVTHFFVSTTPILFSLTLTPPVLAN